ncbi:MAG: DNA polymerase III subunit [Prevotella sp.]|nr:DNA polymerase III subunit [Prevotella sp.]
MKFEEVIGQEEVKERLLQMVHSGKLPHALLFCGPEGSGKMALALAFASYLLCKEHDDKDCCGKCMQCRMLAKWAHPDLHFSYPVIRPKGTSSAHQMTSDDFAREWQKLLSEGPYFTMDRWLKEMRAENQQAQIGVGDSNDLIRKLAFKPSQGYYKICVIWLAERMNEECANKLLKSIEEPPEGTVFLMVSEEPERLLETIKSRTQRIDIPPISQGIIEKALVERRGIDAVAATRISRAANGSWLNALEELDSDSEKRQFFDMFTTLMRKAYMCDVRDLKKWSETIHSYGREKQKRMLIYFMHLVRENFMFNFHEYELNYMTQDEENFAKNFAPFINEANVVEISRMMNVAIRDIAQNANAKIVFFHLAVQMMSKLRIKN